MKRQAIEMTISLLRESSLWNLHGENWTLPRYYRYARTYVHTYALCCYGSYWDGCYDLSVYDDNNGTDRRMATDNYFEPCLHISFSSLHNLHKYCILCILSHWFLMSFPVLPSSSALSLLLQPFLISPTINTGDIIVAFNRYPELEITEGTYMLRKLCIHARSHPIVHTPNIPITTESEF